MAGGDNKAAKSRTSSTCTDPQSQVTLEGIKELLNQTKDDIIVKINTPLAEVKNQVADIASHLNTCDAEIEDLKKKETQLSKDNDVLKATVKRLDDKMLQLEKHDRKYNLLIYGLNLPPSSDILDCLNDFFTSRLGISRSIKIANAHILPRKTSSLGMGQSQPPPIIVRFLYFSDRQAVLTSGPKLKGTKIRIATDLPPVMKEQRGRLSKIAYDLRKTGKQTRIRERELEVILEVKEHEDKYWARYEEHVSTMK